VSLLLSVFAVSLDVFRTSSSIQGHTKKEKSNTKTYPDKFLSSRVPACCKVVAQPCWRKQQHAETHEEKKEMNHAKLYQTNTYHMSLSVCCSGTGCFVGRSTATTCHSMMSTNTYRDVHLCRSCTPNCVAAALCVPAAILTVLQWHTYFFVAVTLNAA
jgi:hypothetical protein